MNAFKKSPVLNRQCLRNKIEELSPLLLNQFNLGISNTLFQVTWSYYASGCQERLTSIRRRIEQNAKIVVPRTQLQKNLNISPTESSLPPGVDVGDHIFHELVSCFCSSDEGPAKVKKPPRRNTVQKGLGAAQYPTPKQWNSWKREEREVQQMLQQSDDPYRAEELTRKLEKLRKLTSRRPLVVLPIEPEEPKKEASKKSKRRSSIRSQKQPEVIPKPGPYVNRSSTAPIESTKSTAEAPRLRKHSTKNSSQASKGSSINLEIKHSSRATTHSNRMYDNISKRSDRGARRWSIEVVSLPDENHFQKKPSGNEKLKKLKSSRTSPRKKFSKISQVSKFREDNFPEEVKHKKDKLKNHIHPIDSLFFLPHKDQKEMNNLDIPIESSFFLPKKPLEEPKESKSFRSILENKFSERSSFSNNTVNTSAIELNEIMQLEKPQSPDQKSAHLKDSIRNNTEIHDKEKLRKLSNKNQTEKPAFLEDSVKENKENINVGKLRKLSNQTPDKKPALLKDSVKENMKTPDVEKLRKPFIRSPDEKPVLSTDFMKKNFENLEAEKLRKPFIQNSEEKSALPKDSVKENIKYPDVEKLRKPFIQTPDENPALLKDSVTGNNKNLELEKLKKPFIQNSEEKPTLPKDFVKKNIKYPDVEKLKKPFVQNPKEKPALPKDSVKENMKNPDVEKLRKTFIESPDEKPALSTDSLKKILENLEAEKLRKPFVQNPEEKPALPKDSIKSNKKRPDVKILKIPSVQSTSSKLLQINPGYKPHKFNRNTRIWHLASKTKIYTPFKAGKAKTIIPITRNRNRRKPLTRDSYIKANYSRGSFLKEIRRLDSIRKQRSWYSHNPAETYIPFRANRGISKPAAAPDGLSLISDKEQAANIKTNTENGFHYDWPLPTGLKHIEYFKSYGQAKTRGVESNQVQTFPEMFWEKRKSSVFVPAEMRMSWGTNKSTILTPPEIRIPFLDSEFNWDNKPEHLSLSYAKTTPSSPVSNEDLTVNPPVIISDIIRECLKTYGSEVSFKDTFTNFMKPNTLDYYPEIPIKESQPKMGIVKKMKPKSQKPNRKKFSKKVLTKPSKRGPPPCSLCNLVRRRQSELRPYMKRMQRQRQRLELKTYYTQKILKDRHCQEARRACTREVLTRCYQALKLCQELLELRLLQRSKEGQSGR